MKKFVSALGCSITLAVAIAPAASAEDQPLKISTSNYARGVKTAGPYSNWFKCQGYKMKLDVVGIPITRGCYKSGGSWYFQFQQ